MFGFGWCFTFTALSLARPVADPILCLPGESEDAHNEVYEQNGGYENPNHEAKLSHEVLGGAAAFEGMKLFEDRQRKEGTQHSPHTVHEAFAHTLSRQAGIPCLCEGAPRWVIDACA